MISPQEAENTRFIEIADWLYARGFSAPNLLARGAGLLLLEDLGYDLIARLIAQNPAREAPLYREITQFLVALHAHPAADFLTPLDGAGLGALTALTFEWYQPQAGGSVDPAEVAGLIETLYDRWNREAPVTCLRDFHAENLLWLPERAGAARLGLLDFQDAVAAHPAYDLVSALQDARRDVSPVIEAQERAQYAEMQGFDIERFSALYALIGAQRSLRILGVFTRLCLQSNKSHYVDLMPRVWSYIARNLAHPDLAPLAKALADLPPPTPELCQRIKSQCPML